MERVAANFDAMSENMGERAGKIILSQADGIIEKRDLDPSIAWSDIQNHTAVGTRHWHDYPLSCVSVPAPNSTAARIRATSESRLLSLRLGGSNWVIC